MNLEDKSKKYDEELKSTLIKCAYIASLHQALKDEVKMIKELKKETTERLVEKAKEVIKSN